MRTDVDILSDYTDFSRWYRVHCPYKIIPIDSIHARISPVNGVIDRSDDVFEAVGRREREREDRPVPFFRDQSGSRYQSISKLGENRSKRTSRISYNRTFSRRISKQFCSFEKRPTSLDCSWPRTSFIHQLFTPRINSRYVEPGRARVSRGEKSAEERK